MMAMALKKPCVECKAKFQHSELEKVKLKQSYVGGRTVEKKCPVFDGTTGVEGLLHEWHSGHCKE